MAQVRTFDPRSGSHVWRDEAQVTAGYFTAEGRYHIGSPTSDPFARRRPGGVYVPPTYTLPDPNTLAWESSPIATMATGQATDVITLSGRNIRSLDKAIPAIDMGNFQGRLVLRHCNLFGFGQAGIKGVIASTGNLRIDLEDCTVWSDNPHVAGGYPGRVVTAQNWKSFRMVHCTLVGTSGVYLDTWIGSGTQTDPTVEMWGNYFHNIDGRCSDPTDPTGWRRGNIPGYGQNDYVPAQMLQFNVAVGVPNVAIHDNEVYNEVGKSRTEDVFSGYLASGTAASPMDIYRNLISGAWTYDAWYDPATSTAYGNNMPIGSADNGRVTDERGYGNSGGGGLLGDGKGSTYLQDPGYQKFRLNTVLGMANYILGASAGHDMLIDGNHLYRAPYVRGLTRNVRIPWRHVPIQIQDYSTGGGASIDDGTGTTTNRVRWYNIDVTNNDYGYTYIDGSGATGDAGLLVNSPLRTNTGNTAKTGVTRADEDAAENTHRQLWTSLGLQIGRTS